MPTQRYRSKLGNVIPGVTTVLNLINKPALVPWAWNLGRQGIDYRKTTDRAANIGTIAHYLIECFLNGDEPEGMDEYAVNAIKTAKIATKNFEEWWNTQGLTMVGTEISLISEVMQVGGTIDCMAKHNDTGNLWLVDLKTSKGVYNEMLYQVAAYWAMWNENYPKRPIQSAHIVQLSKEDGRLSHYTYPSLFKELEIFRHMRAVYGLMRDKDPKRSLDRLYGKYTLERL